MKALVSLKLRVDGCQVGPLVRRRVEEGRGGSTWLFCPESWRLHKSGLWGGHHPGVPRTHSQTPLFLATLLPQMSVWGRRLQHQAGAHRTETSRTCVWSKGRNPSCGPARLWRLGSPGAWVPAIAPPPHPAVVLCLRPGPRQSGSLLPLSTATPSAFRGHIHPLVVHEGEEAFHRGRQLPSRTSSRP